MVQRHHLGDLVRGEQVPFSELERLLGEEIIRAQLRPSHGRGAHQTDHERAT
jgi:hypothetical protein